MCLASDFMTDHTTLSKITCDYIQWGFLNPLSLPSTLLGDLITPFLLLVLLPWF